MPFRKCSNPSPAQTRSSAATAFCRSAGSPCSASAWSLVSSLIGGGVADGSADATGQLLYCCPGEQHAEAEAPPFGCQAYRVQNEDPAADRLKLHVQVRVELAVAGAEDGLGDEAEVGVLAVEKAERIAGVVDIDEHDVDVADVGLEVCAAVVVGVGGDVPAAGCVVGAEPPTMVVPVGERDTPRAGWRDVGGSTDHADAHPSAVQHENVHRGRQVRATGPPSGRWAGSSGCAAHVGHAEVDGGATADGEFTHGLQLLRGGGQGGLDRGDFAGPALVFGLLEPVAEVGVDLFQPWYLSWVNAEERAPDAPFSCAHGVP